VRFRFRLQKKLHIDARDCKFVLDGREVTLAPQLPDIDIKDSDWLVKGKRASEHTNHVVAGVLRDSVVLCCASPCSGVDLQRTSRERGC
jgi:hypothetical protein